MWINTCVVGKVVWSCTRVLSRWVSHLRCSIVQCAVYCTLLAYSRTTLILANQFPVNLYPCQLVSSHLVPKSTCTHDQLMPMSCHTQSFNCNSNSWVQDGKVRVDMRTSWPAPGKTVAISLLLVSSSLQLPNVNVTAYARGSIMCMCLDCRKTSTTTTISRTRWKNEMQRSANNRLGRVSKLLHCTFI